MRSPRTSIILAELSRQRRYERRQRRIRRQRRRRAWTRWMGWLAALARWPLETVRAHVAPDLVFPGAVPLVYILQPSLPAI